MSKALDAALSFEAVKVAMAQTVSGVKLTLVIHPHEDSSELFSHPVGSRYQVALVLVDEEGQPVKTKHKSSGDSSVTSAGILCREPAFQQWMVDSGYVLEQSEAAAIQGIHLLCGMNSRAELRTNDAARQRFQTLQLRFSQSRGGFP